MKSPLDTTRQVHRQAPRPAICARWWALGLVLVSITSILLAFFVIPATVDVRWGSHTGFCGATYLELHNNSFRPLATDGWWVRDRVTQYHLGHEWLLPGASLRLWPGAGSNDHTNRYAGGMATAWEMNSTAIGGLPQPRFITVSCDLG
jgi:hypothetical protein